MTKGKTGAAAALGRGMQSATSSRRSLPAMPASGQASKYTILFDPEMTDRYDRLVMEARRRTGKRLTRANLLRAMLRILDDDQAMRDQVLDEAATEK